jgi:hypothetical protein
MVFTESDLEQMGDFFAWVAITNDAKYPFMSATAREYRRKAILAAAELRAATPHCPPMFWTDGHHYAGDGTVTS